MEGGDCLNSGNVIDYLIISLMFSMPLNSKTKGEDLILQELLMNSIYSIFVV